MTEQVIEVNIDDLAQALGLQTHRFKRDTYDLGLSLIVNEARRLVHGEAFDAKSKRGEDYLKVPELRHLVQAAKNLGL